MAMVLTPLPIFGLLIGRILMPLLAGGQTPSLALPAWFIAYLLLLKAAYVVIRSRNS